MNSILNLLLYVIPAKIALDIGRPVHILVSVAKLEHALLALGKIQMAVTLNSSAPTSMLSNEMLINQSSVMVNSSLKGYCLL